MSHYWFNIINIHSYCSYSEILILLLTLFILLHLMRAPFLWNLLLEWLLVLVAHFLMLHNCTILLHASILRVQVLILNMLMHLDIFRVVWLTLRDLVECVRALSTVGISSFEVGYVRGINIDWSLHIKPVASIWLNWE